MSKEKRLNSTPNAAGDSKKTMPKSSAVVMLLFLAAVFIFFICLTLSRCGVIPSLIETPELPEIGEFGAAPAPVVPEDFQALIDGME